jgi:hypothetical protein
LESLTRNPREAVHAAISSNSHWQHRYVDISSSSDDGRLVLDYGKFHDVTPEEN